MTTSASRRAQPYFTASHVDGTRQARIHEFGINLSGYKYLLKQPNISNLKRIKLFSGLELCTRTAMARPVQERL
jgi:hypothetical protein